MTIEKETLDLTDALSRASQQAPEIVTRAVSPDAPDRLRLGNSDWYVTDADTVHNRKTRESRRLPGVDFREVTKYLSDDGVIPGEQGGEQAKYLVADFLNRNGFTNVGDSDQKGTYDRKIADIYDTQGYKATDAMLASGMARPEFIGKSNKTLSPDQYGTYLMGEAMRAGTKGRSARERAAAEINSFLFEDTHGIPLQRLQALNEMEYAANPELFSSVRMRNKGKTIDNKSLHPYSDSWDTGWLGVQKAFIDVGRKLSDTVGADELEASLAASSAGTEHEISQFGKVKIDYKDVDWTSLSDITEYIGANAAISLPYMGVIAGASVAAPLTGGASWSVPATMYTGTVLGDMEGEQADKNLGVAILAGAAMTVLDKFGIEKVIKPSKLLSKEGIKEATEALAKHPTMAGRSKEFVEAYLFQMTKREIAGLVGNGAEFAKQQIQRGALAKKALKDLSVAGGVEGTTELMQETIGYTASVIGSDKLWNWDEFQNRLTNAAIAGTTLGTTFKAPVIAWEAGQWADVSHKMQKYEAQLENDITVFKDDLAAQNYGYVPTVEESVGKIREETRWRENQTDTSQHTTPLEERTARHEKTVAEEPTTARIREALSDPMRMFREAIGTAVLPSYRVASEAARLLYDMFDGKHSRVQTGQTFGRTKDTVLNDAKNMVKDWPEATHMLGFSDRSMTQKKRETEASTFLENFYKEVIRPITYAGNKTSNAVEMRWSDIEEAVDWENLPEKYKGKAHALREIIGTNYAMLEHLHKGSNKVSVENGLGEIGEVQDYFFRKKAFDKKMIKNNKEAFIKLLMSELNWDRKKATAVTEELITNQEVHFLEDTFDLIKGGISPSEYKVRSANIADRPSFQKFLEQNIFNNMNEVMRSAARFQAHHSFVGREFKHIGTLVDRFERELIESGKFDEAGAQKAADKLALDLKNRINADSGNYKRIKSPLLNGIMQSLTFVTALAGLSLATISSTLELPMVFRGADLKTIHKNVGAIGFAFGRELVDYMKHLGHIAKIDPYKEHSDKAIKGRKSTDPRHIMYDNPRAMARVKGGIFAQEMGAATKTGVQDTNDFTKTMMDVFFRLNMLQNWTNAVRVGRATIYNDFLTTNIDLIMNDEHGSFEAAEAAKKLEDIGVPWDILVNISMDLKRVGGDWDSLDPTAQQTWEKYFALGLQNFIEEASPMPTAMNRPLIYSDPHWRFFTQFQGFISTFTAVHLPKLWGDLLKGGKSPSIKYSAFATMMTMLMMGYASQYLKDLLKYGESSPYLSDEEEWMRAVYSTGLLGTGERIVGSNLVFPIYDSNYGGLSSALWNNVVGEAAASSTVEKMYKGVAGLIEGDEEKAAWNFLGVVPFANQSKHWIMDKN